MAAIPISDRHLTGKVAKKPSISPEEVELKFVSQTSELLWSGMVPLASRGADTLANVTCAARAIDMTVLHPNEIFSFNDLVGIRSEEKGYKPGLMYSNGKVVKGVGGGICIVSTLLYNAALYNGLKIIERHNHSGPVSYADPGLDAAVAFGSEDIVFKNTTDSLLLIRAVVEDGDLSVSVYGTEHPGRTVEVSTKDFQEIPFKIFEKEDASIPEGQVVVEQKARPGYSVTTVRSIKQNGKLISQEVMSHDTVLPCNKIMRVAQKAHDVPGQIPFTPIAPPSPGTTDEDSLWKPL